MTSTLEPQSPSMNPWIASHFASGFPMGFIIEQAAIAPAFTSGVEG